MIRDRGKLIWRIVDWTLLAVLIGAVLYARLSTGAYCPDCEAVCTEMLREQTASLSLINWTGGGI